MNQLHRQTWLDAFTRLAGPAAQQVPGSQPQVFGQKQPEAGEIAADLVGQALADTAFDAQRITGLGPGAFATATAEDLERFTLRAA